MVHDQPGGDAPESAPSRIRLEMSFAGEQLAPVTQPLHALGPVVAEAEVDGRSNLQQLAHIDLTNMVGALAVVGCQRQPLVVGLAIVVAFPDAGQARNPEWSAPDEVGGTQVVDVGCDPASVVQLEEVVARLVVAADEDGEIRCPALAGVVGMKLA